MPKPRIKGDVYIGVLIALAIFLMLSQAILVLANTSYEMIAVTRARNAAREIAQESMEVVRNLPFDSVGTIGGIPPGVLAQSQDLTRNGQTYRVSTTVLYVDDTFDDVAPTDMVPNDYKRVRIEVTWLGLGPRGSTTTLVTNIAPKGVEKATGGGTLSLLVFDSQGIPVPNAQVNIQSSGISPAVNYTLTTNDNGRIVLPGAPACVNCYRVTASKEGMSQDRTYSTSEVANPTKRDLTVVVGGLTEMSFTIDSLSTLNIQTYGSKESNFPPLGSQSLLVRGSKTIGTDTLDNPVYKYNQVLTTNSQGVLNLTGVEWDNYTLIQSTQSANIVAYSNPLSPVQLNAGQNIGASISLVPSTNSLRVAFLDASRSAIASVTATLKQGQNPIATQTSGLSTEINFGQVFFDNLVNGAYTIDATASGFLDGSLNTNVAGATFVELILNP